MICFNEKQIAINKASDFSKVKCNHGEASVFNAISKTSLTKLISGELQIEDAKRFLKERGL
jgi:hypothetical protein